jgi:hypothetical protein
MNNIMCTVIMPISNYCSISIIDNTERLVTRFYRKTVFALLNTIITILKLCLTPTHTIICLSDFFISTGSSQ